MNPSWLTAPVQPLDQALERDALAYQDQLTKPRGSLGCLETLAVRAGDAQLFIGGEMGIGNTASAAALSAPLLQAACALQREMATFAKAAISTGA